ncbi:hypothetical protein CIK76_04800 [Glutamicibacter sp. BW80]|nr:hypothetical protein CIK76_04800 [Glutamicibacter sp. BW80]
MSLNLPMVESRYPDQFPTYDISQFLVNGVKAFGPGSVTATVEPNHVSWDIRLDTSQITDPDNRYFFQNLPADLMPGVSTARIALHGTVAAQVQWNASWRFMQIYSARLNDRGSLSFEARTLRRPA